MSSASPFPRTESTSTLESLFQSVAVRPAQFVGFWAGVLAPLAYPPLLVGGLTNQSLFLLVGVVLVNVVGLMLGRGYRTHT